MTLAVSPPQRTRAPSALTIDRVPLVERDLPAWPVLALLWGGPLWWASGLLPFASMLFAVPMIAFLVRRGRIGVLPGMLPLVALFAWTIPCALMLDAPSRLLGFMLGAGQLASVVVVLFYVVNAGRTLTTGRLLGGLTFTWVFIIVGGYLGMLWPDTVLTATVGQLLPASLRSNEYVSDLLFPPFAEVQTPYGAAQPFLRPSAPFAYTNGWGAGIALLTPVAIATAARIGTTKAKVLLSIGILAAIPPAIATSNRGLFLGLAAALAWVLIRLVFRQHWKPVLAVLGLSVVGAVTLSSLGLLTAIAERQDTVDTTAGRGALYLETFQRTLLSPILGYGSPRPSYTIEVSAGTQGMIWEYMFSFGFVGLALLVIFFGGVILRTWAAPTIWHLWLHAMLVAACVMSLFYGLDRHLVPIVIVVGIMLRERYAGRLDGSPVSPGPRVTTALAA